MHQYVSLGPNGLDRVRSLRKIPTRLRGTNFCTSSTRFPPSFIRQPNGPEMHPNSMKRTKTSVYGLMGWIGCVRCEKFRRDFEARTFALVRPVLHRVSYGNQTAPNAPKWYEMHQNISLGSNGVDRMRSLRKIPTRPRARTFALVRPVLHRVSYGNQTVPNAPKWYKTYQNVMLGSNGFDRVCSLCKIPMRLRGTNFCTSSARFAPSFVRQPNGPERTQIVQNTPKHQFRVQQGGSSAFVVKNSDATSWHELLHWFVRFCTEFCNATKGARMHPNSKKRTKTSI